MYIKRDLEDKISKYLIKRKESLAIIGPRQAGKTTLIKHLEEELKKEKKKVKYITFEKRSDLALFNDSIEDFKDLILDYDFVFIDEFQYAKEGGQKLKYLYDTTDVKFIVSGSSALDLKYTVGKYMVGRMIDFELRTFSFREYLSHKDSKLAGLLKKRIGQKDLLNFKIKDGFGEEINRRLGVELEKFVIFGGYPAVVLSKTDQEKKVVLENILDKFLLKDIKDLLELATVDELLKLGKFLSTQIGNLISYDELSKVSTLSNLELKKHLNVLQKTFIIDLIKPYFSNKRTELVKTPEAFFIDLGLRNSLISDFRMLSNRNDAGALMENYAYIMLKHNLGDISELKYWRTKSSAEVDFILEKEQDLIPIEIKYTSKRKVGKSFFSFIEKYDPKIGIILTKDYLAEERIKNTKVKFIPLSYF